MRKVTLFLAIVFLTLNIAKADEGMWFLAFINKNYEQMKAMGCKLTPEDIYSINKASLKDAIITLDHGSCTGELISSKGLILTNHHCGYGEIQAHSTVENDYLTNGFWAFSMDQELPNPGKTVSFLVKVEDVTTKVLAEVTDKMTEAERDATISKMTALIEEEAIAGTHYTAEVSSFFNGNNYYLCVYEVFNDVRLVGAPPESIGKFGHDTDNWMWPRHTGDFTLFRVYCSPDGKPAEYAKENIPYTPKKYLTINIGGIKENDFTMILGYPGTTDRWLTSDGVKNTMENTNKIRIQVREQKLKIMKEDMDKSDEVRIKYASKYAQCANYYKYSIGQNNGLTNLKVVARKKVTEKQLKAWIAKDETRKERYATMLPSIAKAYKANNDNDRALQYWFEAIYQGPEIISFALQARRLNYLLSLGNKAAADIEAAELLDGADALFKDFNMPTDKKLFVALIKLYKDNIKTKEFQASIFADIDKKYEGSLEKYAEEMYSKSIFTDINRYKEFLKNPEASKLESDLAYVTAISFLDLYFNISEASEPLAAEFSKGYRLYSESLIKLLQEKDKNALFYPDANSTMRLTYGKVGGYVADGKTYGFTTDLDGYMLKEDAKNPEFVVSDKLKQLHKAKNYGRYADKNGKLITCFIANNDITGGNSGSPVMNDRGQLIGTAFDGNWEAMSGDLAFEPDYQRTISVDIRYVLFIIEKYGEAKRLIDEMKIVK